MSQRPLIQVLLATYNGEQFVEAQIDSILAQSYQPIQIIARDDGSHDATAAILADYARRYPEQFVIVPTEYRCGSAKGNFLALMQVADAAYVAFSDQDDVWVTEKIEREMRVMSHLEQSRDPGTPLLIFSDLKIVDATLGALHPSFWGHESIRPEAVHRLQRLLTHNVVTGCTALINAPLLRLGRQMPEDAFMHDWWLALLACTLGDAAHLADQTVLYRQHGGNVLGASSENAPAGIPRWRDHVARRTQWESSVRQAQALLELYRSRLSRDQRLAIEAYVRCEFHHNRIVRTATMVRHGFFLPGIRRTLAVFWYLWDMKRAKRDFPTNPV